PRSAFAGHRAESKPPEKPALFVGMRRAKGSLRSERRWRLHGKPPRGSRPASHPTIGRRFLSMTEPGAPPTSPQATRTQTLWRENDRDERSLAPACDADPAAAAPGDEAALRRERSLVDDLRRGRAAREASGGGGRHRHPPRPPRFLRGTERKS